MLFLFHLFLVKGNHRCYSEHIQSNEYVTVFWLSWTFFSNLIEIQSVLDSNVLCKLHFISCVSVCQSSFIYLLIIITISSLLNFFSSFFRFFLISVLSGFLLGFLSFLLNEPVAAGTTHKLSISCWTAGFKGILWHVCDAGSQSFAALLYFSFYLQSVWIKYNKDDHWLWQVNRQNIRWKSPKYIGLIANDNATLLITAGPENVIMRVKVFLYLKKEKNICIFC